MPQRFYNPFVGIDLVAPEEQREFYVQYCQTRGRNVIDHSPFPRMVDLWFAAMSLAARKRLRRVDLSGRRTFKFHDGSVFDADSWRIQTVMLVGVSLEGEVEIVGAPRRIIGLANSLAAAGVPEIVGMLEEGDQDAIWNISDALDEFLRDGREEKR